MRRTLVVLCALAGVLTTLAGCAGLPDSGPVKSASEGQSSVQAGGFDYHPRGPLPGDSPEEIVDGFLDSMRETPLTFSAARQFLTQSASSGWTPSKRTLVYADSSLTTEPGNTSAAGSDVRVTLGSAVQLDSRGGWQGAANHGRSITSDLRLVQAKGEWRIDNPPDALIVPRNHFDTRYLRFNLYFFEPTAHILVPEPVYLPAGATLPTLLVDGLLQGPAPDLKSVERTFFPDGTKLDISAPVAHDVAQVPLSREFLDIDGDRLDRALAQLAWTLRQVPGVERLRVTVDDTPLDQSTGASATTGWAGYDPALTSASQELFGLHDGVVVSTDVRSTDPSTKLTEVFDGRPLRSFAVSLTADSDDSRVAGVSADGRQLLDAPRVEPAGSKPAPETVYSGVDLSNPSYDLHDFLWVADDRAGGARIRVVRGGRWKTLVAPGITGGDVARLKVSRDGTRLAALVDGKVVVARISRSQQGRPTGVSPAVRVGAAQLRGESLAGPGADIAFSDPATLGVLIAPGSGSTGLAKVSVDGSFVASRDNTTPETLFEPGRALVTWPGSSAPVFVQTRAGKLYRLTSSGHWDPTELPSLRLPAFAG
ncbi:MAG: LpqB family beta-propeller domain-containing protein [Nocardioidaceae bacterium]